jgi:hypothetical protein
VYIKTKPTDVILSGVFEKDVKKDPLCIKVKFYMIREVDSSLRSE